jgi:tRNA-dihydrouridine synthase 2
MKRSISPNISPEDHHDDHYVDANLISTTDAPSLNRYTDSNFQKFYTQTNSEFINPFATSPDLKVLAPMVRACSLPFRLTCLDYGADLVYSEEIIAKKLFTSKIRIDEVTGTLDFLSDPGTHPGAGPIGLVFQTVPREKDKLIVQLGASDAVSALQAAEKVVNFCRGIDINMGCPKSFSTKGGMGAALLTKPEVACDILKTLRRNLPSGTSISCKIRLIEDSETVVAVENHFSTGKDSFDLVRKTVDFASQCAHSGNLEAVALHMRRVVDRPRDPARWPLWTEIETLFNSLAPPKTILVANGDFFNKRQIDSFYSMVQGPRPVMIARGALASPSIFKNLLSNSTVRNNLVSEEKEDSFELTTQKFLKNCLKYGASYQSAKWTVMQMCQSESAPSVVFGNEPVKLFSTQKLNPIKNMRSLCEVCGLDSVFFDQNSVVKNHPRAYHNDYYGYADTTSVAARAETGESFKKQKR